MRCANPVRVERTEAGDAPLRGRALTPCRGKSILDTVSAPHDLSTYLNLLKRDGTLALVGAPGQPLPVSVFSLIFPRRHLSGSLIGGIPETQEMLDFCAEHNITCDIEKIRIQQLNEAYERLLRSDVKYRFVIDLASLKTGAA